MTCPGCGGPTRGAVFCSPDCADDAGGLERAWCTDCGLATIGHALDDDGRCAGCAEESAGQPEETPNGG